MPVSCGKQITELEKLMLYTQNTTHDTARMLFRVFLGGEPIPACPIICQVPSGEGDDMLPLRHKKPAAVILYQLNMLGRGL